MNYLKTAWDNLCLRLKGWKTVLFNLVAALAPIGLLVADEFSKADLSSYVSKQNLLYYMLAVKVANVALRMYTNSPVGKKR